MEGKIVVLTGASSGIGKQTALELAKRGARVVMACRNVEKGEAARAEIEAAAGGRGELEVRKLDLASFSSIEIFAAKANADLPRIDVLMNNAGVFTQKLAMTDDGFEAQIGVNHLGHFLLTTLLLDLLKVSPPSRIIHLTSMLHARGKIDFDSFRGEKRYRAQTAYGQSKLATLLFSNELARRLEGTGVTSNAVHPGAIATDITRDMPWIARKFVGLVFKSVEHGARGPVRLATDPALAGVSGRYFFETEEKEPSADALDRDLAARLWDESAAACGVPAGEGP
jgi:NAD(P)-dependent dehydrogenase (short-subunit alcohol dehydrogenase family)